MGKLKDFWDQVDAYAARQQGQKTAPAVAGVPTEDCGTCGYNKAHTNPAKGVKVDGSFGKCTFPGGQPCKNPKPRLGIGNVKTTRKPKKAA